MAGISPAQAVAELLKRGVTPDQIRATGNPAAARLLDSGFLANNSAAPDPIARRQEYNTAQQQLAKERANLNSYEPTLQALDAFERTNQKQGTGGFIEQIPGVRLAFANLDPEKSQMASISSELQIHGAPQGQGAVSNFERSLYAQGKPDINKKGGVNTNLIGYMRGQFAQEKDRLAFYEQYLNTNGHLGGAQDAWSRYIAKNPYTTAQPVTRRQVDAYGYPASGKTVLNPKRQAWEDYFGLRAPPSAPARPAQGAPRPSITANAPRTSTAQVATRPGQVENGYVWLGGDKANPKNWRKAQ